MFACLKKYDRLAVVLDHTEPELSEDMDSKKLIGRSTTPMREKQFDRICLKRMTNPNDPFYD
jgi:hypothetical protein